MRLKAAVLLVSCLTQLAIAEVHVWFEPRVIDELDSLQLNLRATDTQTPDAPDLSVLAPDFEILGSQITSQRRSVNGRLESWVDYQYTLRPKRSGEITIPPIRVGDQYSAPTLVIVRALDPNVKQTIERMVFFETELTVNPVYVQAQTVFIRRLYYANGVQLYSDLPGVPDVADAVIVPLGETRSTTTVLQGTRYGVIEQRFAIFPEHSGELRIPESAITSSVRLRRDGRTRRSGIRISAPAQVVSVLPIPAEYPADAAWLPATEVRLRETWSPDRSTFNLGDPITRSIAVTTVGNTGSSIPPLQVDFPNHSFKHYPETPTLDDDADGNQLVGSRIESYSLIPTAPGASQLAPVTLTWWDTAARRVRTAHLPPRLLNLHGDPAPIVDPIPAASEAPVAEAAPATPQPSVGAVPSLPVILTLCLALAAALGWHWRHRLPRLPQVAHPRVTAATTRRRALRNLQAACTDGNLASVRQGLLQVLSVVYDLPQVRALPLFLAEPRHAALWRRLNAATYGPSASAQEDENLGAEVWRAARALKARPARRAQEPLPPLYSNGI